MLPQLEVGHPKQSWRLLRSHTLAPHILFSSSSRPRVPARLEEVEMWLLRSPVVLGSVGHIDLREDSPDRTRPVALPLFNEFVGSYGLSLGPFSYPQNYEANVRSCELCCGRARVELRPQSLERWSVQGTRCDMLSTCNCQNLASDTTGEYECDGAGMHDIEGCDDGALRLLKLALRFSRKLSARLWLIVESLRSRASSTTTCKLYELKAPDFLDDTRPVLLSGSHLQTIHFVKKVYSRQLLHNRYRNHGLGTFFNPTSTPLSLEVCSVCPLFSIELTKRIASFSLSSYSSLCSGPLPSWDTTCISPSKQSPTKLQRRCNPRTWCSPRME